MTQKTCPYKDTRKCQKEEYSRICMTALHPFCRVYMQIETDDKVKGNLRKLELKIDEYKRKSKEERNE